MSFSWTRGGLLAAPQRYRWRGLNIGSFDADVGEAAGRTDPPDCLSLGSIGGIQLIDPFTCINFLQRQNPDNPFISNNRPRFAQRPFLYHDLNYVPGEVGLNTRVTAAIGPGGLSLTITLDEGFRFLLPPGATVQVRRAHAAVIVAHDNAFTLQGEDDFGYRLHICEAVGQIAQWTVQ